MTRWEVATPIFSFDEFLPVALQGYHVTADPAQRAVCGISSSGICAFTVAWERPDQFGKVLSHIGSFTNIRGGWAYPGLVRKTKADPKAIKVYLQDGRDDLNNLHGNWPLGNQDLAAALQFAGYEYRLEMTDGGHSSKWGGETTAGSFEVVVGRHRGIDQHSESLKHKPKWEPHPDAVVRVTTCRKGPSKRWHPWESSVFPNTIRDWSIYVPAQYKADRTRRANGVSGWRSEWGDVNGRWRIPTVFDNLIARGDMPPTIAVFINPGHDKSKPRRQRQAFESKI